MTTEYEMACGKFLQMVLDDVAYAKEQKIAETRDYLIGCGMDPVVVAHIPHDTLDFHRNKQQETLEHIFAIVNGTEFWIGRRVAQES